VVAPDFPRVDLIAVYHTGIPGVNQPINRHVTDDDNTDKKTIFADLLRLNLDIPFVDCLSQNPLGVIGSDNAGYPNGRRLGDDVVDITLRASMGFLCALNPTAFCGGNTVGPGASLEYTDQSPARACMFKCATNDFPFLNPPIPGNVLFQPTGPYSQSQFNQHCPSGASINP